MVALIRRFVFSEFADVIGALAEAAKSGNIHAIRLFLEWVDERYKDPSSQIQIQVAGERAQTENFLAQLLNVFNEDQRRAYLDGLQKLPKDATLKDMLALAIREAKSGAAYEKVLDLLKQQQRQEIRIEAARPFKDE